ncbi:hypothetical protein ACXIT0_24845 [Methylorubrum extorquens]
MARASSYVNRRQAANFVPAIAFADTLGRSLNWHVTLNFSHTACAPNQVGPAFERLRDNHYTRWLRYRSQKPFRRDHGEATYVWVIENASGHTHVHWMVYVPRVLIREFKTKVPAWTATVSGSAEISDGTIHIEPVDRPTGLGKYLMKGLDPRIAKQHRIDHVPQGIVHGKRCGISKCLGKAARERFWIEARTVA